MSKYALVGQVNSREIALAVAATVGVVMWSAISIAYIIF
jgi:hypothetical protein